MPMQFINAEDILPPEIIAMIPAKFHGHYLYLPKTSRSQRQRKHILARVLFSRGMSVRDIALKLGYSPRNIRFIVNNR